MDKENETRRSIGARRNPASAEAILEAAEAVLAEAGHAGFSIEAVARRARAGKPTIYRWWPSKTALLLDVYQRQKRFAYPDTGNIEEDIAAFLHALLANWRNTASGPIFRSIIAEAQSDENAAKALAAYAADRRTQTGTMIERAKARGEVAADADPATIADLVSSFAWSHLLTGRLDANETKLKAVARLIAQGIEKKGDT
ncbi:TetR/AcrR family transcriptional regulator [Manganibacter manganicus]|uniref:TetR family transcriptional regulator n=1 Tax=Manganibacter manganicus TaxID=1873176 RepID=A0A1V8RQM2_9HYPH|nr:TetR/AcrR family transcriptional regulator [Pseudaminobacter manganicus]OQM75458.1 TetR family transcriptional regulator [Pseudaminobacter manganicus]